MFGNAVGLALSISYFILFMLSGILLSFGMFKKSENPLMVLLLGNVFGIALQQWLPVVFAFFFDFTILTHVLSAFIAAVIAGLSLRSFSAKGLLAAGVSTIKGHKFIAVIFITWIFFCFLVCHGFRFETGETGTKIFSSQATYGDMSMHLGFITSIAVQQGFPPDYSILPGTRLSYPFLSDSISSSLYLLGAPLYVAYVLPMFAAAVSVLGGVYALAYAWLKDKAKAALGFILFFFNGGFGFIYFFSEKGFDIGRLMNSFYETPTNLVTENIRWVNIIVDMLLPQRATLFGWAILFPALYILYRGVYENKQRYFLVAGIMFGLLPMVHSHSFVVAAGVCICWLIGWLLKRLSIRCSQQVFLLIKILLVFALVALSVIKPIVYEMREEKSQKLLYVGGAIFFIGVIVMLGLTALYIFKNGIREIFRTWGILLLVVLVLALPQLFIWTFSQIGGGGFFRGLLNWVNAQDGYVEFYVKNIGVSAVLIALAILFAKKKDFVKIFPAFFIWGIAELIKFQPNEYDNNKLLYPAFLILAILGAGFTVDIIRAVKLKPLRVSITALLLVVSMSSALLTMARESVSSYLLYNEGAVNAVGFIETLEPDATFLSSSRHNNEIAALSGRNILCGSPSYLYFHGLSYRENENAVKVLLESPESTLDLYQSYGIDYVYLGPDEINSYNVDSKAIANLFECVYNKDGIEIYKVN